MKKIKEICNMEGYIELLSDLVSLPKSIQDEIIKSFKNYYKKTNNLETIHSINIDNKIYTKLKSKFEKSPKPEPLSRYIKKLKSYNNIQICPYCGINRIDTDFQIEHFLPKSKFGEYTLFGFNLFPCCSKCNPSKGDKWDSSKRIFLNPYIDDLYNKEFLKIVENQTTDGFLNLSLSLNFDNLDTQEISLIKNHFLELGLIDKLNEHIVDLIPMIISDVEEYINSPENLYRELKRDYSNNEKNFGKNSLRTIIIKYFLDNFDKIHLFMSYKA